MKDVMRTYNNLDLEESLIPKFILKKNLKRKRRKKRSPYQRRCRYRFYFIRYNQNIKFPIQTYLRSFNTIANSSILKNSISLKPAAINSIEVFLVFLDTLYKIYLMNLFLFYRLFFLFILLSNYDFFS